MINIDKNNENQQNNFDNLTPEQLEILSKLQNPDAISPTPKATKNEVNEQRLLGAILQDDRVRKLALQVLKPGSFVDRNVGKVFETIERLTKQFGDVEPEMVESALLEQSGKQAGIEWALNTFDASTMFELSAYKIGFWYGEVTRKAVRAKLIECHAKQVDILNKNPGCSIETLTQLAATAQTYQRELLKLNHSEEPNKINGMTYYDIRDLDKIPKVQWLVNKIVPLNSTVCFYGPPGSLKSFVILDLLLSVGTGVPFLNQYQPNQLGECVYFMGEGLNGIGQRTAAWQAHREVLPDNVKLSDYRFNLQSEAEAQRIIDWIEKACQDKPKIVAFDTLARHFGEGDENSAKDMGAAIRTLDIVREHFGCAIVIAHHTGKDVAKGERGSIALRGALDASFCLEKEVDKKDFRKITLTVTNMKSKDEEGNFAFECNVTRVDLGDFRSSLVLDYSKGNDGYWDWREGKAAEPEPYGSDPVTGREIAFEEDEIEALPNACSLTPPKPDPLATVEEKYIPFLYQVAKIDQTWWLRSEAANILNVHATTVKRNCEALVKVGALLIDDTNNDKPLFSVPPDIKRAVLESGHTAT